MNTFSLTCNENMIYSESPLKTSLVSTNCDQTESLSNRQFNKITTSQTPIKLFEKSTSIDRSGELVNNNLEAVKVIATDGQEEVEVVVLDFETTGLCCKRHRVIEVGAVILRGHKVLTTLPSRSSFLNYTVQSLDRWIVPFSLQSESESVAFHHQIYRWVI